MSTESIPITNLQIVLKLIFTLLAIIALVWIIVNVAWSVAVMNFATREEVQELQNRIEYIEKELDIKTEYYYYMDN